MPGLTDAEIAGEVLANYLRSHRDVAEHCGGEFVERDGVAVKDTRLPIVGENAAFVVRPLTDPVAQIDEAARHFERQGIPYGILIPEGLDIAAERACIDRGLALVRVHPGMALHPLPVTIPTPPSWLDIRRVETPDDHAVHIATDAAAFGGDVEMMRRLFPASLIERAYAAEFLGFVDDVPVATSLLLMTGHTAGAYGVATIASHRGRGIGEAMTWRVVADGLARGATMSSLQASDMGRPLYERMGFRVALNFHIYAPAG